jgi:sugar phosphate isomerase/epimerase
LAFELDAYWVQYSGMNPERWVRNLGDKLVSLHLKDFGVAPEHRERLIRGLAARPHPEKKAWPWLRMYFSAGHTAQRAKKV